MNGYATIKLFCDGYQSYEYCLIRLIEFQHVRIQRIQRTLSFLSQFPIVLIWWVQECRVAHWWWWWATGRGRGAVLGPSSSSQVLTLLQGRAANMAPSPVVVLVLDSLTKVNCEQMCVGTYFVTQLVSEVRVSDSIKYLPSIPARWTTCWLELGETSKFGCELILKEGPSLILMK